MSKLTRAFLALARIPDKNEARPALAGIHARGRFAYATDGYILARAVLPTDAGLADETTYGPAKAFQQAATVAKTGRGWAAIEDGQLTTSRTDRPPVTLATDKEHTFPDCDRLLSPGQPDAVVALNPTYLRMLADIADDAGAPLVRLGLTGGPSPEMRTTQVMFQMNGTDGELRGAVMPMYTHNINWAAPVTKEDETK